jgi:hypothetical protein
MRMYGPFLRDSVEGVNLLTEQEVSRSWQKLFVKTEITADTFVKAEMLLDELRAESPLRHRLSNELEELRQLHKVGETVQ